MLTEYPVISVKVLLFIENVSVLVVLTTCNILPTGNAALATPVQLVRTPDAGVPKAGVTRVGEVPNTLAPLPVLVVTPVPPLATGNVPVTPVVKGSPVQLVNTPLVGVPNNGVTKVGDVAKALAPLPVDEVTPVPPLATGSVPLIFVVKEQYAVAVEFVPPLAIGSVPVTPVVIGRPVQLVSVPLEGVPKAPPDASRVPVVAGRVITVVPAIAGAAIVTEPDVSPAMTILDIYYP